MNQSEIDSLVVGDRIRKISNSNTLGYHPQGTITFVNWYRVKITWDDCPEVPIGYLKSYWGNLGKMVVIKKDIYHQPNKKPTSI